MLNSSRLPSRSTVWRWLSVAFISIGVSSLSIPCRADTKAALRVLRDECLACHKPGKAKGGLLLHSHEKMTAGGDSGEALIPGKANDSLLYQVLLEEGDPHMPPKKQLADTQIAAVKQWIDAGAPWDQSVFDEPPPVKKIKLQAPPSNYQPVLAMALSPDEKLLAVAQGNEIRLIDLTQEKQPTLAALRGHLSPVQSLTWTPDGKQIISGGFQELIRWDAEKREKLAVIDAPFLGSLTALIIDKVGKFLFLADTPNGGAGYLHRIELDTNKLVSTWKGHDDTIYALRISPNQSHLLSGSADKLVKMWNVNTLKMTHLFEGHTSHVMGADFNHDGTQIASTGADREVKIWEVEARKQLITLGNKKMQFAGLDWSNDGTRLVAIFTKGGGSIYSEFKVHDGAQSSTGTKQQSLTPLDESLTCVCITSDAKTIYAGSFEGKIHRWDAANGKSSGPIGASK